MDIDLSVDDVARLVRDLTPEQKARVVHCKHEPFDVYIGRAMPNLRASDWANLVHLRHESERRAVLRQYTAWLLDQQHLIERLHELEGLTLGCWCRQPGADRLCHGLVLVALTDFYQGVREDVLYEDHQPQV